MNPSKKLANTALLYGSISLFTTVLHNVFLLYHIEMFVSVFKIDKTSFWIGETLFLIWNSLNDPFFGWLGDYSTLSRVSRNTSKDDEFSKPSNASQNKHLVHRKCSDGERHGFGDYHYSNPEKYENDQGASPKLIMGRMRMISFCGPLMALSFMLLWFDWMMPSIQFAVCLCLYDAFLTMIDLQHSALLAELSPQAEHRTKMNSYQSVFSAIGSLSVFLSYSFWDKDDLTMFRMFCVVLAVVSAMGFYLMSNLLRSSYLHMMNTSRITSSDLMYHQSHTESLNHLSQGKSLKIFVKQLLGHRNFIMFTVINVIQVFHCHFNSNFFPLFMEALVEDHKHYGSFLIGVSFVLPHLNNVFFLVLCRKYGAYVIIKYLFIIKLLLAVVMWSIGLSNGWLLCFFIASNRVFTEGTCNLLSLVITDLVDEDFVRNNRNEPISALIFGMANFLAKPGQTLAPVIGTFLLSSMTGHDVFSKSSTLSHPIPEGADGAVYREACFKMLVYVPIICASLQIVVWTFFKLHGTTLERIKNVRSNIKAFVTV